MRERETNPRFHHRQFNLIHDENYLMTIIFLFLFLLYANEFPSTSKTNKILQTKLVKLWNACVHQILTNHNLQLKPKHIIRECDDQSYSASNNKKNNYQSMVVFHVAKNKTNVVWNKLHAHRRLCFHKHTHTHTKIPKTRYTQTPYETIKSNKTKQIGQAYSINTDEVYPFTPPRYGQYGEGKAFSPIDNFTQNLDHNSNAPIYYFLAFYCDFLASTFFFLLF